MGTGEEIRQTHDPVVTGSSRVGQTDAGGGDVKRRSEFMVGVTVVAAVIAVTAGALWLSQTSLSRDQM